MKTLPILGLVLLGGSLAWYLKQRSSGSAVQPSKPAPAPTRPAPMTVPDVSSLVSMTAFDAFPEWVQRYEGKFLTLYQDTLGLVTTGIGNLVDPIDRVVGLPFFHEDGRPADAEEIRAEWRRVKAMPPGLLAARYVVPGALRLSPEGLALLVRRQNALNVQQLARSYPDLPNYPAAVQTALMGMAWAMGAGFPAKWPTFSAAVRGRDWKSAADNSHIKNANKERNEAHRDLFLSAVGIT